MIFRVKRNGAGLPRSKGIALRHTLQKVVKTPQPLPPFEKSLLLRVDLGVVHNDHIRWRRWWRISGIVVRQRSVGAD